MHKYYAKLIISEVKKPNSSSSSREPQLPRIVYQEDFPETTFIAVTAYQNEEVLHSLNKGVNVCILIHFLGYSIEDYKQSIC